MGSTGKTSGGATASSSVAPITGTQKISMSSADTQAYVDALNAYKQRYTTILNSPQAYDTAKEQAQAMSDAIDQLVAYQGIPKTSTGYTARVIADVLPVGSTVVISNARRALLNGTWTNSPDMSSPTGISWRLTRDGGGRLAIAQPPRLDRGSSLVGLDATTLRVDKVGRFK